MFSGIVLALAAAAAAPPAADPLAPAARGEVQCYQPDEQRKTCRSIASYRPMGGARYSNKAVVLVSPAGPVILETTVAVVVRDGAVCGTIRAEDLASGALRVGGRLLEAKEAAPLLARLGEAMGAILGKEICTTYRSGPKGMIASAAVGGVRDSEGDQPVKWVRADAGYSVAP